MIKAIIYNTNSGFSKQYAYNFALNTGLPIYNIKDVKKKLNKGDKIIYFSWINANKIVGLKKLKDYEIVYACSCGMFFYNDEIIEALKKNNNIENIYYLQGGIRWRELKFFQRLLVKMVLSDLKRKNKKNLLSDEDKIILDRLNFGYEKIDLNSLNALVEWYKEQKNLVS